MIELLEVCKTFHRGSVPVPALQGVTLTVAAGEFVVITGKSGCGKSTLLHIIGGLETPTSGLVRLNGRNLSDLSDSQLTLHRRDVVGVVFQHFNLLPLLSLQENVALPRLLQGGETSAAYAEAAHWLARVGLAARAQHKPHQVSGGEMQRAAIARALINRPAVLLADEPTGNLDSATAQQVLELFSDIHRQWRQTVIMVTHAPEASRFANRTLPLRDGRLVS